MRSLVFLLLLLGGACLPSTPTAAPLTPVTNQTPTVDANLLAPDFTATSLSGTTYTLSALRGRWVILNFWATWCIPCAVEMPTLQQIADAYGDQIILLGVNLREDAATVAPFVADHGLRFPILIDPDDTTLLNYQVVGLPQTLVISPEGEIVYRQFGAIDFDRFGEVLPSLRTAFVEITSLV